MERFIRDSRYKVPFALFCAFGWSLAYPLIKVGYGEFQILGEDLGGKILFGGIRFFFAGLLVCLFCLGKKTGLKCRERKDYGWLFLLALVNTTLHYMFAYIGLGFNSSARSTILDSMGGFFLIILSTFLFADDRISLAKGIGCILGLAGIIAINLEPGVDFFENISFEGDGMILINTICAAFGGILTRVVSRKMNMLPATGVSMLLGGAMMIGTGFLFGTTSAWRITPTGMIVLAVLVLISALCFAVYNELLAVHPISKIAIYNALIPVLGVIFAAFLLGEELKVQYLFAVLMVAVGIFLVNRKPKQPERKEI